MRTIYSAENKLSYVLDYLKDQVDKDVKLYQPSKVRYDNMLMQCKEIMRLLCKLLQQDELAYDDTYEFDDSEDDKKEIDGIIKDMQDMLNKLQDFSSSSHVNSIFDSKFDSTESDLLAFSSQDRHDILIKYSEVLQDVVSNSKNAIEKNCAKYLQEWLSIRFNKNICKSFRYNICSIPEWMCSIVYTYGVYTQYKNYNDFNAQFDSWFDVIQGGKNTYPLPYFINATVNDKSSKYVTLAGPVLWDMLTDDGLCELENYKLSISTNLVYEKCNAILDEFGDDGQLDTYTYYKYDSTVLVRSNLIEVSDE